MHFPKISAGEATPNEVKHVWDVVRVAAAKVEKGNKPCDYGPWTRALEALGYSDGGYSLVDFADAITRKRWTGANRHLVEFAIAFLEADVKLFRSGYASRRLLIRLMQSELRKNDIARLGVILCRVVAHGTGLEEHRVYCKLAARLLREGHLRDLGPWLHEQALGAVVTVDTMPHTAVISLYVNGGFSDEDICRLHKGLLFGRRWGFIYPELGRVVRIPKAKDRNAPENRVKRNAYYMLAAVQANVRSHGVVLLADGTVMGA